MIHVIYWKKPEFYVTINSRMGDFEAVRIAKFVKEYSEEGTFTDMGIREYKM